MELQIIIGYLIYTLFGAIGLAFGLDKINGRDL